MKPGRMVSIALVLLFGVLVLRLVLVLLTATNGGPATAPADPCALIAGETLRSAVPSPKVTRSEADNYATDSYAYCEVETDRDKTTSTATGGLDIDIQRHGSEGFGGREEDALEDFVHDKEYDLQRGEVLDVPRLGDSAFLVIEGSSADRVTVELTVLAGADTMDVRYVASPSSSELASAAAVAVARSVVKGLS